MSTTPSPDYHVSHTSSMRITYLHQYFNTPAQSGGTRSYEMARRLVARGHQVTMITSRRTAQGRGVREEIIDGIRVLWIPVPYDNSMSYPRRVRAFVSFALRSARLARSVECDIVFATSTPLTIAIPAMYSAWRRRVPWVLEVRDLWPEVPIAMNALKDPLSKWAAMWLAMRAYKSSAHVIALSPGMAAGVRAHGVPARRVTVIPNCCDVDLFGDQAATPDQFLEAHPELRGRRIVLYPGTLGRVNGVDYLVNLAAAARELDPSLAFVVMGSGGQESLVRELASIRGVLNRNFFMYPSVSKHLMPSAFSAADVCLSVVRDIPALRDNSANKFFDALASGRPIAINHEGWLADLIRKHEIGIVLSATDIAAAAVALAAFMSRWPRGSSVYTNARDLAVSAFDREELASQLERVLHGALGSAAGAYPVSGVARPGES
jgi:glycosyltransferase involved in cell wall biosynthesis